MNDTVEPKQEEINWTVKKQEAIQKLDKDLITQLAKPEAKEKGDMSAEEVQIAGYLALADKVTAAANELREAVKHEKTYLIKKQIQALGLTAADLGLETKVEVVIEREGGSKIKRESKGPFTLKYINTEGQIDTETVDNLLFREPSVTPSFWAYCNFMKNVTIDRSPKKPSIFKRNDLIDITDDRLKAISKEYIDHLNK